jgi:hypothetical protein
LWEFEGGTRMVCGSILHLVHRVPGVRDSPRRRRPMSAVVLRDSAAWGPNFTDLYTG